MEARGTVDRPTAAQNRLMFWQTMPASTAAMVRVRSESSPKREMSATSTRLTGASAAKDCAPATAARWSPVAMSWSEWVSAR